MSYVSVQDGNVTGYTITANTSHDNGGNTLAPPAPGWDFTSTNLSWTGAVSDDWAIPGNWSLGYVPNAKDIVTIANLGSQPATLVASDETVASVTVNLGASLATSTHILTLTGSVSLSSVGNTSTSGGGTIRVAGAVNFSGGTYTKGGTIIFNGGVTQNVTSGANDLGALSVQNASTNVALQDPLTVDSLTISAGTTMGTNGNNLVVSGNLDSSGTLNGSAGKSIAVTGDTTGSGTINLNGSNFSTNNLTLSGASPNGLVASGSESISVGGSWNVTNFTPFTSTVTFTGAGSIQGTPLALFYNLVIQAGGANTVSLASDITITNSLTITSGILSAGTYAINMNGSLWNNTAGTGAFLPGSGTVTLFAAPSAPGTITINGSNNWNIFTCTTGGAIIKFQNGKTQTMSSFIVNSATTLVTLTTDSLGLPWFINASSASVFMAAVSWSTAVLPNSITAGSSCVDNGNNTNWLFIIPIVASWTLDTDNNGRIDRIRVQLKPGSIHNNSFGGFQVQVDGYTVNGYQQVPVGTNTDVFDIMLKEGAQEDTGATPTWQITTNTSFAAGGALVDHNTATVVKKYVAASGARPVITYTAAALNTTQVYVHFSDTCTVIMPGGLRLDL